MKLKLILTTAILGTALALPGASSAQAPALDSVTGEGGNGLNPTAVRVDASSGPSGENPTGTVAFHFGGGNGATRHGDVSCLSVSGNTAIIGFGEGYFRLLVPMQTYWVTGLVRIVDNGPTGDTFEYVELQTGETEPHFPPPTGVPLPGPTYCSSFPSDRQVYDVAFGGFVVTDSQPAQLPTSIRDCLKAGWREFGFNRLGECIKFVLLTKWCDALEHHGYHPPFCPPAPPRST